MTTSDARPPQPRRPADRAPSGVRIPRAPGRPRDPRTDEAIIAAALHELATVGFAGLSMEAVAASAGVGKATVYRRWPTKDALIGDALDTLADEVDTVETGSLRDDLVAWLNALRRRNMHSLAGRIMPQLAAERTTHPDLFATYSHRVLEPSRRWAADLLRRGIDSGELAADVDVDLIVDMLIGPVSYRQYLSGDREVSGGRTARIVDVILVGIRAPASDTDPITTATATAATAAAATAAAATAAGGTGQLPAAPAVAAAPNGAPASGTAPPSHGVVPSGGVATFSGAVVAGPQPAGGQLATPRLVAYPVGAPFALGQTYPVLGRYPASAPGTGTPASGTPDASSSTAGPSHAGPSHVSPSEAGTPLAGASVSGVDAADHGHGDADGVPSDEPRVVDVRAPESSP